MDVMSQKDREGRGRPWLVQRLWSKPKTPVIHSTVGRVKPMKTMERD